MNARFRAFTQALRSSRAWSRPAGPGMRARTSPFILANCTRKFSASSLLRQIKETATKAIENASKTVSKAVPKDPSKKLLEQKSYPENLVVYNAGEFRLTMVAFWKSVAIFQFGVTSLFLAPKLWFDDSQPGNIRKIQATVFFVVGAIPTILMAYLTSPFVKTVAIRLPAHARRSHAALLQFAANAPAETLLEFTTLRIFPIERKTTCFLFELRALPRHNWWRFANLERVLSERLAWKRREMSTWRKFLEVINEPRFKFHVREGRQFEANTPAGMGVWTNLSKAIRAQTNKEELAKSTLEELKRNAGAQKEKIRAKFLKLEEERKSQENAVKTVKTVKRQTARSTR